MYCTITRPIGSNGGVILVDRNSLMGEKREGRESPRGLELIPFAATSDPFQAGTSTSLAHVWGIVRPTVANLTGSRQILLVTDTRCSRQFSLSTLSAINWMFVFVVLWRSPHPPFRCDGH